MKLNSNILLNTKSTQTSWRHFIRLTLCQFSTYLFYSGVAACLQPLYRYSEPQNCEAYRLSRYWFVRCLRMDSRCRGSQKVRGWDMRQFLTKIFIGKKHSLG